MSLAEKVVTIDEVAAALGRPESWVRRNWLNHHLEHGMPRKMASGWVWPRRAMERWIDQWCEPEEVEAPDTDETGKLMEFVANENKRLRERYAGGHA